MIDEIAAVAALKSACDDAYDANPNSCSHAVWAVIKALADPNKAYEQANALIDTLNRTWTTVDVATAGKLANEGKVVVGGLKATGNGHVIVVYPGPAKTRGGYRATKRDGTSYDVRETGLFPRAMSTSIGSWPGAMSKGDKTVWDPWGNDDKFSTVKFWHKEEAAAKTGEATSAGLRWRMNDANSLA